VRDITIGETFDVKFTTTEPDTGAPSTLAGTPVVSAYVGNSTTQLTAGITLTVDFDGVTGLHNVRVVATVGNGYAAGTDVALVITTGTVDGNSAVGYVIEQFTIGRGAAFTRLGAPAGASAAADIAAIKTETASIQTDTNDIQARLPAALVSGRIDASVGAMAANVMTAAAAAADLTTELQSGLATAANLATVAGYLDTEIAAILAAVDTEVADIKQMLGHKTTIASLATQVSFTLTAGSADDNAYNGWGAVVVDASTAVQLALGVVSDYTGSTKTITLRENPGIFTMATGDTIILLPGKLTDGVNVTQIEGVDATDQLDAHAAAGLDAAGIRAAVGLASANLDTQLAAIESQTDDIGTAGAGLTAVPWNAAWDAEVQSEVTDALNAYDPPTNTEMEARTIAAANYATAANLATVAGYLDTEVAAILAAVDTEVGAIKTVTDALPNAGALTSIATAANLATVAGYLDTEIAAIKSVTDKLDTAMELDTAVYRFTTNSLENAPTSGGGAADWTTGEKEQIRHRLGIDGDVDAPAATPSLATAAALQTVDDYVDTEMAAVLAAVDTEVAAIKVKTDQLTFDDSTKVHAAVKRVAAVDIDGTGTTLDPFGPV
jgi:hypothetical protein